MWTRSFVTACALLLAAPAVSAETLLERGAYLVNGIAACGNCHTPQTPEGPAPGRELAGQLVLDVPEFTAYAPNITPDPETGIGTWTDADLARAIREGIRPDGSLIGPPMPFGFYRNISDADLAAIVAYVKSVPAVRAESPDSEYRIPLPPAYGPPIESVAVVSPDDPVRYGEYLAGPLGHCMECHTPFVNGHPDIEHRLGAGGVEIPGPWGVSVSANLTPHPADGIAHYSDDDLKAVITTGVRPDGTRLLPPMGFAYYANMNDRDLNALIAYLRQLPPLPSP